MALRPFVRQAINSVIVFSVFTVLVAIAPDGYEKHAEMRCDTSGKPVAIFPDIVGCAKAQVGTWQSCGCVRPEAEWAKWYPLAVLPIATVIAALLTLTGSVGVRLLVLNFAVSAAIIANAVYSVTTDPAYAMVMHLVPFEVLGFCVGITILFMLLDHARSLLRRGRTHAT